MIQSFSSSPFFQNNNNTSLPAITNTISFNSNDSNRIQQNNQTLKATSSEISCNFFSSQASPPSNQQQNIQNVNPTYTTTMNNSISRHNNIQHTLNTNNISYQYPISQEPSPPTNTDSHKATCLEIGQAKIQELSETIKDSLSKMQMKFQEVKTCLEETTPVLTDARLSSFYENLFGPAAMQSLQLATAAAAAKLAKSTVAASAAAATPSKHRITPYKLSLSSSALASFPSSGAAGKFSVKKPGSVQYKPPAFAFNKSATPSKSNSSIQMGLRLPQKSQSVAKFALKKQTPVKFVATPLPLNPPLVKKIQKSTNQPATTTSMRTNTPVTTAPKLPLQQTSINTHPATNHTKFQQQPLSEQNFFKL